MLEETSLLPHLNPGVLTAADFALLRPVAASMGLMLETHARAALAERGGPHFGSPDKLPAARLETLRLAGEARVPFTTGILIGIGETREERLDALLAIAAAELGTCRRSSSRTSARSPARAWPARPSPRSRSCSGRSLPRGCSCRTNVSVQAPPNLSEDFAALLDAGIDDWGGVSPVTIDHVNPEAPWPEVEALRGRVLRVAGSSSRRG